jgi:hypothetical protein
VRRDCAYDDKLLIITVEDFRPVKLGNPGWIESNCHSFYNFQGRACLPRAREKKEKKLQDCESWMRIATHCFSFTNLCWLRSVAGSKGFRSLFQPPICIGNTDNHPCWFENWNLRLNKWDKILYEVGFILWAPHHWHAEENHYGKPISNQSEFLTDSWWLIKPIPTLICAQITNRGSEVPCAAAEVCSLGLIQGRGFQLIGELKAGAFMLSWWV